MSKKKVFGLSKALSQGLSDTFTAAKNNAGNLRFEVVPLAKIETDPLNPRELSLSVEDIITGLKKEDPSFGRKQVELESLIGLANTIKEKGLINPVVVYKHDQKYRLVAGERRYLASHIAQKEDIQARILNEKPNELNLRLLQWIENTGREDLSLRERILNIKTIIEALEGRGEEVTATLLKDLLGISLSQTTYYLAIINSPTDVLDKVLSGEIENLDKAVFIAKIKASQSRQTLLSACIAGSTLKEMKILLAQHEKQSFQQTQQIKHTIKRGKILTRVNLGSTKKTLAIKKMIDLVITHPLYEHYEPIFSGTDWNRYDHATEAFKQLLNILEKESEA